MNVKLLTLSWILAVVVIHNLPSSVYHHPTIQDTNIMDGLIGSWEGTGTLMGSETTFNMQWEWVLTNKFIKLTFEHKRKNSDGREFVFMANAYYHPAETMSFEGTWFDSRGMTLPLKSNVEHNQLITLWWSPETEQGKTIYRLLDNDTVEVEDYVLSNNEMRLFGTASYKRKV